ncbi:MAG: class I SAM-dependent methyltransferase [Candidatus Bipolaricaulota bacterium]|nr:class I SAM-dependent methyltransferase [Candidatus Bipolaricaulota bacterium]MDW8111434.1 class I SAM-dependent methyltransferase [Candidatus Bipolaricaulota bacterium]MDW8329745.1 class I SAM-dependent methyltransferase [Candidatus Bipolaricaulota bacterium]
MEIKPGEVVADVTRFDEHIKLIVPRYEEMHDAVIRSIPPDLPEDLKILELGCGTGELTKKLCQRFPKAQITAIDYSIRMLEVAREKLSPYCGRIRWIEGDFAHTDFPSGCDVVISTLAIHHLTDPQKLELFRKIHKALKTEGWFVNGDVVLFESDRHAFLHDQVRAEHALTHGVALHTLDAETHSGSGDNLSTLKTQLALLEIAGFHSIDVIWKYYQFVVYGGFKYCLPNDHERPPLALPDF